MSEPNIGDRVLRHEIKDGELVPYEDARGNLVRGLVLNVSNEDMRVQWDSEWVPLPVNNNAKK